MSGLSVVKSYCGHGIGDLFHCAPNIPHYASILQIAFHIQHNIIQLG
ncbi:putative methionyl aminopeptidase [Helianthus annuus]|nr:putative methionyl aminopeptidase [Helianthus annuus]